MIVVAAARAQGSRGGFRERERPVAQANCSMLVTFLYASAEWKMIVEDDSG